MVQMVQIFKKKIIKCYANVKKNVKLRRIFFWSQEFKNRYKDVEAASTELGSPSLLKKLEHGDEEMDLKRRDEKC
jgi:hypothetical protein